MLIGYRCIHYFSEEAPSVARFLLLRFDDVVRDRLVHGLHHVGDIGAQVGAKGRHQADGMSENWNMAEEMTGRNKHLECTFVVLLEIGSVQESYGQHKVISTSPMSIEGLKKVGTKWLAKTVLGDGIGSEAVEWI